MIPCPPFPTHTCTVQTPLFDKMFEEFASKHLLHKLEQRDRAAVATVSAGMESV